MGRPVMKRRGAEARADVATKADLAMGSSSYAQYTVARKSEGKYKIHRGLVKTGYVLFPILCIVILAVLGTVIGDSISGVVIVLGALTPLYIWMIIHFTWPYFSHSYYYEIDSAEISFFLLLGQKKRKLLFDCKIKDFSLIAPLTREYEGELQRAVKRGAEEVFAASSRDAMDLYFAIAEKDGKTFVVYFEAIEQALKALRHYNSEATVMTQTRR